MSDASSRVLRIMDHQTTMRLIGKRIRVLLQDDEGHEFHLYGKLQAVTNHKGKAMKKVVFTNGLIIVTNARVVEA